MDGIHNSLEMVNYINQLNLKNHWNDRINQNSIASVTDLSTSSIQYLMNLDCIMILNYILLFPIKKSQL